MPMAWECEYERWRDMGHTWGPGVDDLIEFTAEELAEQQKSQEAFQNKLASYRVAPRQEFLLAGKELEASLPPRKDRICGTVTYDWRKQYNDEALVLCRRAAETLGISFDLMSHTSKQDNTFTVTVDYYGWLAGRSGNVHRYAASGIQTLEDCLQIASDFAAIGKSVTTYFGKAFHYSCNDTGELWNELASWAQRNGRSLPRRQPEKLSFDVQVTTAQNTALQSNHLQKINDREVPTDRDR